MKIKDISLVDLQEYGDNPRHNENAVNAVAESIKEFGFKVPIVVDSNNVIVAGHTRLKAARLLGLDKVPCIVADDLTPEQVKAFRLADNKTSELAEWDFSLLEKELSELSDIDMSMFGFTDSELDFSDDIPQEVELPREEQGVASQVPSIKFGSKVINLTEEERERFEAYYKNYLEEHGTAFGLILELLNNGDRNYES